MSNIEVAKFSFLENESVRKVFRDPTNPSRMKFYIEGMKCSKCVAKVEALQNRISNVQSVSVDLGQHLAVVEVSDPQVGISHLAQAIQNLGFEVTAVPWNEMGSEEWKKESRKQALRIGV